MLQLHYQMAMAESLQELLSLNGGIELHNRWTFEYLKHIQGLSLSSLSNTEPEELSLSSHSLLISSQSLSTKSHKAIISSSEDLSSLQESLPSLARDVQGLEAGLPELDKEVVRFSELYNKNSDNALLERRRRAMLLSRSVDRIADVLELPALLSSTIQSSASNTGQGYASALDLYSHIRRLHTLFPASQLVLDVTTQAEAAMQAMTTNLLTSLRAPNIKLAAGIRMISWLRRVAPDLDDSGLGASFLLCRLANLVAMLDVLEPLRELAEHESNRQGDGWSGGQQTERYLKRYIEVFREQSFAIVSMYRSIFPSTEHTEIPSPLATFPHHLVSLLSETLQKYLPNVRDRSSKESLLTQVLYCAGSLGRLGGDFGMVLAFLGDSDAWVEIVRKHRVLAGKLELMANGVNSQGSTRASSPST
jgi:hypothetical protein